LNKQAQQQANVITIVGCGALTLGPSGSYSAPEVGFREAGNSCQGLPISAGLTTRKGILPWV